MSHAHLVPCRPSGTIQPGNAHWVDYRPSGLRSSDYDLPTGKSCLIMMPPTKYLGFASPITNGGDRCAAINDRVAGIKEQVAKSEDKIDPAESRVSSFPNSIFDSTTQSRTDPNSQVASDSCSTRPEPGPNSRRSSTGPTANGLSSLHGDKKSTYSAPFSSF